MDQLRKTLAFKSLRLRVFFKNAHSSSYDVPSLIIKGVNGFEELRKIVKQGAEFAKDVANIMQERADLETTYAKGLSRLSTKIMKLSSNSSGSLCEGWKATSVEMECESDFHKHLSRALWEEISKPLKTWVETQQKTRRPIEAMVEKAVRQLADRRNDEYKTKKNAFSMSRDLEKFEEQLAEARDGKGKYTDRDITKLEKKCRQQYDVVQKCDKEYSEACQKAEAARQEWDLSILKGAAQMQVIEEDRINKMQELLKVFNSNISQQGPQLSQAYANLDKVVSQIDLKEDLKNVMKERGTGPPQPHQILFDCYAEDMNLAMNVNRRKQALKSYLFYIESAVEREKKGKEGVEKLLQVYKDRPNFADADAQDEAKNRLMQVTFTLNFLEASHLKINTALSVMNGQSKPNHRFVQYIETLKDKQGIPTSTLRLPLNIALEGGTSYIATSNSTGSVEHSPPVSPYDDFDQEEFSDDEFDNNYEYPGSVGSTGQCRVMYDYSANADDELDIKLGDIINVYTRQPDGWWQGELHGKVGIFPANYVEEI
ncbi:nostrin isoform X4 [Octopus sinensis]|uniref:Nostrin isoform X4 n=1 Tax=Octopus sinensis TaxID=2607531 RepID=A0A7E6F3L3_9MOLL|nr:nostrin isoform X4 [Octopus sinensis]